ncbi:RidA family protein [Rubrobacter indicoceani]|uniref:RidA family protein n=1 Tax=Rubrobacter indicoceani TaxID=2051957 RepID=UPI000E5A5033|nr:RidA family protein [Rubrobacter indicoceani]
MNVTERLAELGLELPGVPAPAASYIPAKRTGDLIFTAGQLPFVDGELPATGKVGSEVSPEEATRLAWLCALNALSAAASVSGGPENLASVVKVVGFVASAGGFNGQPQVINGASRLLGEVFGEAGHHARSAVGVAELPLNSPVEVEVIFEASN